MLSHAVFFAMPSTSRPARDDVSTSTFAQRLCSALFAFFRCRWTAKPNCFETTAQHPLSSPTFCSSSMLWVDSRRGRQHLGPTQSPFDCGNTKPILAPMSSPVTPSLLRRVAKDIRGTRSWLAGSHPAMTHTVSCLEPPTALGCG